MELATILFALSAVLLLASTIIYQRSLERAERRLNALRSNCFVTSERGHRVRYTSASEQVRARAEATITERNA